MARRCDACALWSAPKADEADVGVCRWAGPTPIWVEASNGSRMTFSYEGRDCKTWKERIDG